MATVAECSVKDSSSSTNVPVEGLAVTQSASNPTSGQVLRQAVVVADGGGAAGQYQSVDSNGNASVVPARTGTVAVTTQASVTSATELLAARTNRLGVTIFNNTSVNQFIGFNGSLTSAVDVADIIPPGAIWKMSAAWGIIYNGALYVISDSADGNSMTVLDWG